LSDGLEDTVIPDHPRPKLVYPFEHGPKVGGAALDIAVIAAGQ